MPYYTPLRYPGGKRRLAPAVVEILKRNRLSNLHYAEPYAGGASVGLALLLEEHALSIHINDLSRPVFAVWHSIINEDEDLCDRIEHTPVSMRQWKLQKAIFDNQERASLFDLGFATFFLNRANRSGILGGGVIGGRQQKGKWGVDARFNKPELIRRIQRIARYRSRIHLYQLDAEEFLCSVVPNIGKRRFTFIDPPYIKKGDDLYMNDYTLKDHRRVAQSIRKVESPWIVTYDSAAVNLRLFPGHPRIVYRLSYSAQDRLKGMEVMFLSKGLHFPNAWRNNPRKVQLTRKGNRHAIRGKIVEVHGSGTATPSARRRV